VDDLFQEASSVVNLTETVELVTEDVKDKAIARRDVTNEMDCVGFIKLQYGDICTELSLFIDMRQEGRGDAACEVAAGWVGENFEVMRSEKLDDHLGRRRFAVGARDNNDPKGEVF
jgi:hypothetical protein